MPTYTDQFFLMDPANPPPVGTKLVFQRLTLTDANNDLDFDRFNNDSVNGSDITQSYPGDRVTISTPSGNITYTGITFYTASGVQYFTPTDGQVLVNGTLVSTTFVTVQGPLLLSRTGPSCLVAGTRVATAHGMVRVEDIVVGTLVKTLDNGMQPVRWAGRQTVTGTGAFAPVCFAPGVLDNPRPLLVSQQHRMLLRGWSADLHFGASEVLVAAKHLVNGRDVTLAPCRSVTYLHLMFDRHEVLFAENTPCESFHPGDVVTEADAEVMDELHALFPDFEQRKAAGDWDMARPVLHGREAAVL